jgi:hypothetical protein
MEVETPAGKEGQRTEVWPSVIMHLLQGLMKPVLRVPLFSLTL